MLIKSLLEKRKTNEQPTTFSSEVRADTPLAFFFFGVPFSFSRVSHVSKNPLFVNVSLVLSYVLSRKGFGCLGRRDSRGVGRGRQRLRPFLVDTLARFGSFFRVFDGVIDARATCLGSGIISAAFFGREGK